MMLAVQSSGAHLHLVNDAPERAFRTTERAQRRAKGVVTRQLHAHCAFTACRHSQLPQPTVTNFQLKGGCSVSGIQSKRQNQNCTYRRRKPVVASAQPPRNASECSNSECCAVHDDAAEPWEQRPPNAQPSHEPQRVKGSGPLGALCTRRAAGTAAALLFALPIIGSNSPALAVERAEKGVETPPGAKTKQEWAKILPRDAYMVLVDRGTEQHGTSPYDKLYEVGVYNCRACDQPLFSADSKFDSGTGWPSFYDALPGAIEKTIEVGYLVFDPGCRQCQCKNCGCHLGHVFTDGPAPTGLRYCMNGVALQFVYPDGTRWTPEVADARIVIQG